MLEEPVDKLRNSIAQIAKEEWWYFGCQFVESDNSKSEIKHSNNSHNSLGAGNSPGFRERVWFYFRYGVFYGGEEWRDYTSWAWSGAFISYCFRKAGAGEAFPYSPAHYLYVMDGVKNRSKNLRGLKTFGADEVAPGVGDLLWKGRMETAGWGFSELKNHFETRGDHFRSHCDIVDEIDHKNGQLWVIGGNVRNRVLRLKVDLDEQGRIKSDIYTAVVSLAEF